MHRRGRRGPVIDRSHPDYWSNRDSIWDYNQAAVPAESQHPSSAMASTTTRLLDSDRNETRINENHPNQWSNGGSTWRTNYVAGLIAPRQSSSSMASTTPTRRGDNSQTATSITAGPQLFPFPELLQDAELYPAPQFSFQHGTLLQDILAEQDDMSDPFIVIPEEPTPQDKQKATIKAIFQSLEMQIDTAFEENSKERMKTIQFKLKASDAVSTATTEAHTTDLLVPEKWTMENASVRRQFWFVSDPIQCNMLKNKLRELVKDVLQDTYRVKLEGSALVNHSASLECASSLKDAW